MVENFIISKIETKNWLIPRFASNSMQRLYNSLQCIKFIELFNLHLLRTAMAVQAFFRFWSSSLFILNKYAMYLYLKATYCWFFCDEFRIQISSLIFHQTLYSLTYTMQNKREKFKNKTKNLNLHSFEYLKYVHKGCFVY